MRKNLILFMALLFSTITAFTQTTVKGKIIDSKDGSPLSGASIKIKGSNKGISAGADGTFTIEANTAVTLDISMVGFTTKTVKASPGETVTVVLESDTKTGTEVVVTALGQTRSKAKVGYATSNFSSEQITRSAPTNLLDGLSGKIAGANISKTGGPGSSTKVVLRGYGVIGNNQPLYVIDGVPLNDGRFAATDNVDFGNGLNDLNPNDIESISVLRGTAAASLYGSNAKNGAIMITTKRGKSGKIRVDYAGSANFSRVAALPEMQSIFGQGWGGIFVLPENGSWGPKLDGKMRAWGSIVDNSQLIKPFSFVEDNLRDFYNVGAEYNNSISLSGGNEISQFYFSYGNVSSDGIMPSATDYYTRNTVALRTNSKFNNLTLNSSFNYVNKRQNVPYTGQSDAAGGSTFEELLQIPVDIPIKDFKDYHNKFFNVDNYFTPYAENPYYPLYENGNTQNSDRFFGNLDMSYKFTNEFSAQFRVGADFTNARTFRYKAVNAPSPGSWNAGGNTEGQSRAKDVGSVQEQSAYLGSINGDFILKYNKDLSHVINLEAFAGVNYFQEDQKAVSTRITDLLIPNFYNFTNTVAPPVATNFRQNRRRIGTYLQTTFGYDNQLFLTLNARNDWSSTLPINNNSFFYPSANLSWVASKTFDLSNAGISFLKFRAGYGKTGSDAEPYLVDSKLTVGSVGLPFGSITFPFNGVGGFGISNIIGNPNLEPVITKEAEIGTEIRFLKNRVGLDLSLYNKRTEGQIINVPTAPSTGYTAFVNNLGVVENKGIEAAFDVKPIDTKNFSWTLIYTYAKNWNKVLSLSAGLDKVILNTAYDAELVAFPGKSLTGIYAPVPKYSPDGKIIVSPTTGMPVEDTAKGFYGNAQYDYMMGLANTFTYKDFQLSFSLDFRKGGVMYSGTSDLLLFTGNSYATTYNDRKPFIVPNSVIEVVDPNNPNGKPTYIENTIVIDQAGYGDYWYPTQNKAGSYTNRIIDKSFLKLRDVSLSYNLPNAWASKIKASNIALGIYARNFLLWRPESNFYMDPELSNLGNDLNSELGEFRTGPSSQQYGITLRASF